jgi:hypothetical protein
LRQLAQDHSVLVMFTTSLSLSPSMSLADAWDHLDEVTSKFTRGRWLTSRVAAYKRYAEVTKPEQGWHPHQCYLLALPESTTEQLANLKDELGSRWAALATSSGYYAEASQQDFAEITHNRNRAVSYVAKGPMGPKLGSRTGMAIFIDAVRGDAEAAADWLELEEASAGRTWQMPGGEFRKKKSKPEYPVITGDPGMDRLLALTGM